VKRNGSRSCLNRSRFGSRERDWLKEDVGRGCVYIYGGDSAPASVHVLLCYVLCCGHFSIQKNETVEEAVNSYSE
uniref:Uncharacterized protein n=1 Tax=Amazona collaria TaxID=241587 RepID=A0A8B9IXV0_9PSIT